MPTETNTDMARSFVRIAKRAETIDPGVLRQTFVDAGTLLPSISTHDNQVIFGRRGTGKTHVLIYTLEEAKSAGALTVYVELRTVGSTTGLYTDSKASVSERATRLLLDVLIYIHNEILAATVEDKRLDLSILGPLLDDLAESFSEVRVEGQLALETQSSATQTSEASTSNGINVSKDFGFTLASASKATGSIVTGEKSIAAVVLVHCVEFGRIGRALNAITEVLPEKTPFDSAR